MTWSDLISRRSLDDIRFLLIISVYVAYYVIIIFFFKLCITNLKINIHFHTGYNVSMAKITFRLIFLIYFFISSDNYLP